MKHLSYFKTLTGTRKRDHISPIPASLYWLPVKSKIKFKILLITCNNQAPDLIVLYHPERALCFQTVGLIVVSGVCKGKLGGRAFSFKVPLLWSHLTVWIQQTDTLSTFKNRLNPVLFDKACTKKVFPSHSRQSTY